MNAIKYGTFQPTFSTASEKNKTLVQKQPAFCGLQTAMSARSLSFDTMQALLGIYPKSKGRIGNMPKEMVKHLKAQGGDTVDIKSATDDFFQALADVSEPLREIEKETLKSIDEIDVSKYIVEMFAIMQNGNMDDAMDKMNYLFQPPKETIESSEQKASETLTSVLRNIKLIPQDGTVSLSHIGAGAYGNVFRVSFLDSEGKKIFHDKALKVYKNDKMQAEVMSKMSKKMFDYFKQMSKEDFVKMMTDIYTKTAALIQDSEEDNLVLAPEEAAEFYGDFHDTILEMPEDGADLAEMFNQMSEMHKDVHGALPEANKAMLINKKLGGRMDNTNMIKPHMFDLKNRVCLMEFADDELPAVTKQVDLEKMGLNHADIEFNKGNTVKGRIIDYGGIMAMA